jgi:hypothetical protein
MLKKSETIIRILLFVFLLFSILAVLVYLFKNRVEIKLEQDPYRVPDYSAQEAF